MARIEQKANLILLCGIIQHQIAYNNTMIYSKNMALFRYDGYCFGRIELVI